jgi:hypothetical protein
VSNLLLALGEGTDRVIGVLLLLVIVVTLIPRGWRNGVLRWLCSRVGKSDDREAM